MTGRVDPPERGGRVPVVLDGGLPVTVAGFVDAHLPRVRCRHLSELVPPVAPEVSDVDLLGELDRRGVRIFATTAVGMLEDPATLARLVRTALTLVVIDRSDADPLACAGALLEVLPRLLPVPPTSRVVRLRPRRVRAVDAWQAFGELAHRGGATAAELWTRHGPGPGP